MQVAFAPVFFFLGRCLRPTRGCSTPPGWVGQGVASIPRVVCLFAHTNHQHCAAQGPAAYKKFGLRWPPMGSGTHHHIGHGRAQAECTHTSITTHHVGTHARAQRTHLCTATHHARTHTTTHTHNSPRWRGRRRRRRRRRKNNQGPNRLAGGHRAQGQHTPCGHPPHSDKEI